ncbi:MAG: DMT family transporter [Nanoarchaeota archaeon]|nr:DMT family transporter [Nanoarchaeota archaeon]
MAVWIGIMLAFVAMITWGFSDLVTKLSLDKESKWKVLFLGQLMGGLLILLVAVFFVDFRILASKGIYYLFILGLVNLGGVYTFYKSMKEKGVALTSPIVNSWALITIALGLIFYKEAISSLQWLAVILIIGGVFVVLLKKTGKIRFDSSLIYAVISMVFWGLFFFLLKEPNLIFGALIVASSVKLITSFFSIPILIREKVNPFKIKYNILFYIVLLAIFDGVGFSAFNFALKYSPVSIASIVISATPIVSVTLGIVVLKEKLSLRQKIAIIAVIAGLILVSI